MTLAIKFLWCKRQNLKLVRSVKNIVNKCTSKKNILVLKRGFSYSLPSLREILLPLFALCHFHFGCCSNLDSFIFNCYDCASMVNFKRVFLKN